MTSKEGDQKAKSPGISADQGETLGYEYFPHRAQHLDREGTEKKSWLKSYWDFITVRDRKDQVSIHSCQHKVIRCFEENLMVRLLLGALKSKGCEVKLSRHVSCEPCKSIATGGYDGVNKQVVVCSNNATKQNVVCNVLSHELIHAFDDCRAKMDLTNLEHLACTEIRAANLMHCTKLTAIHQGKASLFGKQEQKECVKWKAKSSMLTVRDISGEEADAIIDRVFDKCYPDLEPVGRIPRNPYTDGRRLYVEASLYGYTESPIINEKL